LCYEGEKKRKLLFMTTKYLSPNHIHHKTKFKCFLIFTEFHVRTLDIKTLNACHNVYKQSLNKGFTKNIKDIRERLKVHRFQFNK